MDGRDGVTTRLGSLFYFYFLFVLKLMTRYAANMWMWISNASGRRKGVCIVFFLSLGRGVVYGGGGGCM